MLRPPHHKHLAFRLPRNLWTTVEVCHRLLWRIPSATGFPPPYANGGGWDGYGYHGGYPPPPLPVSRSLRDEPPLSSGRRLGDRIGGYAPGHEAPPHRADGGHGIEGLPPKPPPAVEPGPAPGPGGRRNDVEGLYHHHRQMPKRIPGQRLGGGLAITTWISLPRATWSCNTEVIPLIYPHSNIL